MAAVSCWTLLSRRRDARQQVLHVKASQRRLADVGRKGAVRLPFQQDKAFMTPGFANTMSYATFYASTWVGFLHFDSPHLQLLSNRPKGWTQDSRSGGIYPEVPNHRTARLLRRFRHIYLHAPTSGFL